MRTICITVPELKDERAAAEAHFKERGVAADFIDGIHGVKSGIDSTLPYEYDNPKSGFRVGPKIISLALNHYMTWVACTLLPDETFLILEADAKFPEDWRARLNQMMLDVPSDWDVIYVGSCNCTGKTFEHIKGEVYKVNVSDFHSCPHCSQSILYTKKAIRVAIETQRRFYVGVDLALIFHTLPLLNVYVVLPSITGQFGTHIDP